jgi:hypothetical protein
MSGAIDFQTIPSELLNVRKDQDLSHLRGQAHDVLGYCKAYRNEPGDVKAVQVINCTMHTPSAEQLEDLNAAAVKSGKVAVMVGGQLGLMTQIIALLNANDFFVAEAITDRVSKEVVNDDGTVQKISIFKHMGLRQLGHI